MTACKMSEHSMIPLAVHFPIQVRASSVDTGDSLYPPEIFASTSASHSSLSPLPHGPVIAIPDSQLQEVASPKSGVSFTQLFERNGKVFRPAPNRPNASDIPSTPGIQPSSSATRNSPRISQASSILLSDPPPGSNSNLATSSPSSIAICLAVLYVPPISTRKTISKGNGTVLFVGGAIRFSSCDLSVP